LGKRGCPEREMGRLGERVGRKEEMVKASWVKGGKARGEWQKGRGNTEFGSKTMRQGCGNKGEKRNGENLEKEVELLDSTRGISGRE